MKLKSNLVVCWLIVVIASLLVVAGCAGNGKEGEPESKLITITDSIGRSVELSLPLEKVIVLNSDAAEAMRILKVDEKIIGAPENVIDHAYLEMGDKESVGKWNQPSFEKMVELQPQVVISYASSSPGEEVIEKLEPAGVKVVLLDLYKPDRYDSELLIMAEMFGREKEAAAFVEWKAEQIAILDQVKEVPSEQRLNVFAMSTSKYEQETWGTFGSGTATHQAIERSGGINVAGELEGYPEISSEWILEQNPDAVVFADYSKKMVGLAISDSREADEFKEKVLENKVFSKTSAAKEDRIYIVDNQLVGGDKTYLGALYLAKLFYPEQFAGVDPDKVLQEYFDKWLGLTFKGRWAYPLAE